MNHDHPDVDRLTFGCPACIHRVQVDQFADEIARLELDDLRKLPADGYMAGWKWAMVGDEITRRRDMGLIAAEADLT